MIEVLTLPCCGWIHHKKDAPHRIVGAVDIVTDDDDANDDDDEYEDEDAESPNTANIRPKYSVDTRSG